MKTPKLSTIEAGRLNAQQRLYALLQASSMTAQQMMAMTKYRRHTVYRTLSALRAQGLISTRRMDTRQRVYLDSSQVDAWDKDHKPAQQQLHLSLNDSCAIASNAQP